MAEPPDRDCEAEQTRSDGSDGSDGSDEGLCANDLDIDTLASIWKDDLLLDAIGGAPTDSDQLDVPFDVSADRQLIEALLSWRRELEPDPITPAARDPVRHADRDSATSSARRHRFRVPLVSALAAAVVLAFTAMAAYGATPSEALWPITEVLYSEHAASVRAAKDVDAEQAKARAAIAAGKPYDADAALHAAANRIPQVRNEDGRTELQNRQRDLARQFNASGPLAAETPAAEPRAPSRDSKPHTATPAAPSPTSPQIAHSARPEDSSAQATKTHHSTTETGSATTTPPTRPTSRPASATPTSPQQSEQPGTPPRPTRSASAATTQPATSATQTNTRAAEDRTRNVEPARSSNKNSPPTAPPGPRATKSAPSAARTAKPPPSVRTTGIRHTPAASNPSTRSAPTPRERTTPSPSSAPP